MDPNSQWLQALYYAATPAVTLVVLFFAQRQENKRAGLAREQRRQIALADAQQRKEEAALSLGAEIYRLDKADLVARHTEAYMRWFRILWFDLQNPGTDVCGFINEMNDWARSNRLYLTDGAYKAFMAATSNKFLMSALKGTPHHVKEAFEIVDKAGQMILDHSPSYARIWVDPTEALEDLEKRPLPPVME